MNSSIIKRIDSLGRIVLPKEVRKKIRVKENDEVEIIIKDNNVLEIRKYSNIEDNFSDCNQIADILANSINSDIFITDREKVVICTNLKESGHINNDISDIYLREIEKRKIIKDEHVPILNINSNKQIYSSYIVPLIIDSQVIGAVGVIAKDGISEDKQQLIKFSAQIMINKMGV